MATDAIQTVDVFEVELRSLGARMAGDLVTPGDESWDEARQAWNLDVEHLVKSDPLFRSIDAAR